MSSVLARYEVSGERRKPKPSGSTSSVPSPKIETPFFAWLFSMAKIRSCLRIRLAFSMPFEVAISTSCVTWCVFSSDRCVGIATAPAGGTAPAVGAGVDSAFGERTASGGTAWGLLILGMCALKCRAPDYLSWKSAWQSLKASDVAVKKGRELGLGQRADAGRLDVAVLEQHQGRDAADAELGRRELVLVDVDLGDLQPALVFLGHLVEDRRDRLARPAPLGPVVDQHRGVGLQDLGLEGVVGDTADGRSGTAGGGARHGLLGGWCGKTFIMGAPAEVPKYRLGQVLNY